MIKNIKWQGITVAKAFVMNKTERIQREWLKNRFMEGNARNDLLSYVGKQKRYRGGTFVDCGAHIGNHSIFFATVCEAERVFAFEPYAPSCHQWKRNIALNDLEPICELQEIALGEKKRKVGVNIEAESILNQIDNNGTDVQMLRLDAALKGADFPGGLTLIKIDVDGSELITLKGAKQTLKKHKPDIAIECATDQIFTDVWKFLEPLGYEFLKNKEGDALQLNPTPTFILRHA